MLMKAFLGDKTKMDDVGSSLTDAVEATLDRLESATLSAEGRQGLLDRVASHQQARGHRAIEEEIAKSLFDENKANIRQAIEAFRDAVVPSRMAEALALLQEFIADSIAVLEAAEFDVLGQKLTAFSYTRNRLSQPVPRPSPEREAQRTASIGWNPLERECLAAELRDETPLKSFDAHQAMTSTGRVISRQELRKNYRPGSWTRIDTWFAQFPAILEDQG
jgi:hypothetical protein